jgi:hypothetical protein
MKPEASVNQNDLFAQIFFIQKKEVQHPMVNDTLCSDDIIRYPEDSFLKKY